MSAGKTRFSCNHQGYGSICHRCQAAERLEKFVEANAITKNKQTAVSEAKAEAARLRAPSLGKTTKRKQPKQQSSGPRPESLQDESQQG